MTRSQEITGWHVLAVFIVAFGIIIAVNLTLAFNAVRTFPGLEVKNSYVASQSFDRDRTAQLALGWQAHANVDGGLLRLSLTQDGRPAPAEFIKATFGRATHTGQDQRPAFAFDGRAWVAPVQTGPGNWNLRLEALAPDGTLFRQRIVVRVAK